MDEEGPWSQFYFIMFWYRISVISEYMLNGYSRSPEKGWQRFDLIGSCVLDILWSTINHTGRPDLGRWPVVLVRCELGETGSNVLIFSVSLVKALAVNLPSDIVHGVRWSSNERNKPHFSRDRGHGNIWTYEVYQKVWCVKSRFHVRLNICMG